MKIAVFHNLPEGGAKIALYEQVKRLKKKHEIDLFTFISEESEYDLKTFCNKTFLFPYEAVKTKKKGLPRIWDDIRSFTTLKGIHREIAHSIDQGNYDIAFISQSRLTQAPYILQFLKTPSVYYCQEPLRMVYEHGLQLKDKVDALKQVYESANRAIRKRVDRANALKASLILTSSNFASEYITLAYGIHPDICPLGVDAQVFRPKKRQKRDSILFIGSRSWIDGFNLVKDAMTMIPKQSRPKLNIVSYKTNTNFSKSQKDLVTTYSQALVTVCAAVLEPFGLIPLESMACETPVIAVNEGGYRETVVDGKTGFLIERDPKILAEKVRFLVENQQKARKMGKTGRAHVMKNWTWNKHLFKLEQVFEKMRHHEA